MNALVGVRSNVAGTLSADPAKRAAAWNDVHSLVRANYLSRLRQASGAAGSAPSTTSVAKSAKSGEGTGSTSGTDGASGTGDGTASRNVTGKLDKDTFLQLLVSQMQNQDPMAPTDNTQMIAQLAQFTSLEQMNNLNTSFQRLSGNVDQLNFITANSLIGRAVSGLDTSGNPVSGTVDKVQLDGSIVYLTVGSQTVSMAGVMSIGAEP